MSLEKPIFYKSLYFNDERGALIKNYLLEEKKFSQKFKDSYISISKKNVFRGLHYQKEPYSQEKFFTVLKGEVNLYCLNTSNYSENFCFNMIPENGLSLYVPKGWATGIYTPNEESIIYYSSNQIYKPESQININYKVIPDLKNESLMVSKLDD